MRSSRLLVVAFALLSGCAGETYPPAIPAHTDALRTPSWQPPVTCYVEPQALKEVGDMALGPNRIPSAAEWKDWRVVQATTPQSCTGKGKKRRCTPQKPVTAVDQANQSALVRPTIANTKLGTSGRIRYPYDPTGDQIYEVLTSPSETTWLLLPPGMRVATKLLLDDKMWEEEYDFVGEGAERQQVVALRPRFTELKTRGVLHLKNGQGIQLSISSQERPGMLRVTWVLPEPPAPPPPSPDQLPPRFDNHLAYNQYTIKVLSKNGPPGWLPTEVVDDGKNTLIRLPDGMEGLRAPIASGIQQNGNPTLVSSRLWSRPADGYWLYVQGLHPAVELRDAAGTIVRAVRHVPPALTPKEMEYDQTPRLFEPARAQPAVAGPRRSPIRQ